MRCFVARLYSVLKKWAIDKSHFSIGNKCSNGIIVTMCVFFSSAQTGFVFELRKIFLDTLYNTQKYAKCDNLEKICLIRMFMSPWASRGRIAREAPCVSQLKAMNLALKPKYFVDFVIFSVVVDLIDCGMLFHSIATILLTIMMNNIHPKHLWWWQLLTMTAVSVQLN